MTLRQEEFLARTGLLVKASVCVALAYLMIFQDDFLGLGGTISHQSARLVELGAGILNSHLYPGEAQKHLVVVTIDENSLASTRETNPPSHHFHVRVLRRILAQQPRAVFVDILLDTCRDGTSELLQTLNLARSKGIPVYVAAGRPERAPASADRAINVCGEKVDLARAWSARAALGVLPEIAVRAIPVDVMHAVGDAESDEYCLVPGMDREHLCLPAEQLATLPAQPNNVRLSAAYQIYRDLCGAVRWRHCGKSEDAPLVRWPPRAEKLDVMWGYRAADSFPGSAIGTPGCREQIGLGETVRRLIRRGLDSLRLPCPYTPSVSAMSLLVGSGKLELGERLLAGAPQPHAPNDRRPAGVPLSLSGRVVLYGFDLAGSSDVIRPPTHLMLPGVFLHAMALDNLLTWGEHYKAPAIWLAGHRIAGDYVTFATFIAVFLLCFLVRYVIMDQSTVLGIILGAMANWYNLPILCLLLGAFYSIYLDLATYNWLAIVGFASAVPAALDSLAARGEALSKTAVAVVPWLRQLPKRLSAIVVR